MIEMKIAIPKFIFNRFTDKRVRIYNLTVLMFYIALAAIAGIILWKRTGF
jgi:hypothetical protein